MNNRKLRLTVEDVARYTNYNIDTVFGWVSKGKVYSERLGENDAEFLGIPQDSKRPIVVRVSKVELDKLKK